MKNVIIAIAFISTALIFMNFTKVENQESNNSPLASAIEIPNDVQEILDNSCFGCHNSESQNLKGKKKLQFDKLNELKTYKAIGKLTDITDVIAESDMPPAKILKKYPDMTLSDEQKEVLSSWAKKTAEGLAGE